MEHSHVASSVVCSSVTLSSSFKISAVAGVGRARRFWFGPRRTSSLSSVFDTARFRCRRPSGGDDDATNVQEDIASKRAMAAALVALRALAAARIGVTLGWCWNGDTIDTRVDARVVVALTVARRDDVLDPGDKVARRRFFFAVALDEFFVDVLVVALCGGVRCGGAGFGGVTCALAIVFRSPSWVDRCCSSRWDARTASSFSCVLFSSSSSSCSKLKSSSGCSWLLLIALVVVVVSVLTPLLASRWGSLAVEDALKDDAAARRCGVRTLL